MTEIKGPNSVDTIHPIGLSASESVGFRKESNSISMAIDRKDVNTTQAPTTIGLDGRGRGNCARSSGGT